MSNKKIEIKRITSLENLLESLKIIYLNAYEDNYLYAYRDPKRVKKYLKWLFKHFKDKFLVAFDKDKPIGFLVLDIDCHFCGEIVPEIHEVVVAPEYQKRGVGHKLMDEAFKCLKALGYKKVALWVGEQNFRAKRFYEQLGFKETVKQDKWVRMEKILSKTNYSSENKSNNASKTKNASTTSESSIFSSGV